MLSAVVLVVQLWFDLFRAPSGREADLLEEVLASWFMLGRLGAYNAQNLQVTPLCHFFPCQIQSVIHSFKEV